MSLFSECILHFDERELRIMFSDVSATSSATSVTPATPGKTYCIMLRERKNFIHCIVMTTSLNLHQIINAQSLKTYVINITRKGVNYWTQTVRCEVHHIYS